MHPTSTKADKMKRLVFILSTLFALGVLHVYADGVASVNYDIKTEVAMATALGAELATEKINESKVNEMYKHYASASLATAGIYMTKYMDRRALREAGLFGSEEENHYYRRIYALVSTQITPRIITLASSMIEYPDKALYWGPYLLKTCDEVQMLCTEFSCVVTNGKLTFQDVAFATIPDHVRGFFDLAKYGDVDWKTVWDNMVNFGENITKEDIISDIETIITGAGISIATAGQQVLDGIWSNDGATGKSFGQKPSDIIDLYEQFESMYALLSNPAEIRNRAMSVIGIDPVTGKLDITRLFDMENLNIGKYLTEYPLDALSQYYTQKWSVVGRNKDGQTVEFWSETFDSQSMDLAVFTQRMQGKRDAYAEDADYSDHHIEKGEKKYYQGASEARMKNCGSVSYTVECDDGAELARGNFQWKVNERHGGSLDENSKAYAMQTTLSEPVIPYEVADNLNTLSAQIKAVQQEIADLEMQNNALYREISSVSVSEQAEILAQIKANKERIASLKSQLNTYEQEYNEWLEAKNQLLAEYSEGDDGYMRIPSQMQELQSAFNIEWMEVGHWEGFTFVRKGQMAGVPGTVTFRAELTLVRKESKVLGIRVHRAILGVAWTLTSEYSSENVVAVIDLDRDMTDAERAELANSKYAEVASQYPDCRVTMDYAYINAPDSVDLGDPVHLLWVSDRLAIARQVESRLVAINSQLMLLQKYMDASLSLRDQLKIQLTQLLTPDLRGRHGRRSYDRWRELARRVQSRESPYAVIKDEEQSDEL